MAYIRHLTLCRIVPYCQVSDNYRKRPTKQWPGIWCQFHFVELCVIFICNVFSRWRVSALLCVVCHGFHGPFALFNDCGGGGTPAMASSCSAPFSRHLDAGKLFSVHCQRDLSMELFKSRSTASIGVCDVDVTGDE